MSYIENTWLAYAWDRAVERDRVEAGLKRVEAHYGELYADPLTREERTGGSLGVVLWRRPDPRLLWPLWAEAGPVAVAATNVPTGWERLVGEIEIGAAAVRVGEVLRDDPEQLVELNPPFVLGVHDERRATLTIVNDFIATGRLYELRTSEGWVWSNRLGALPLFAGVRPEADPQGWGILAATGWFVGAATPIRGAEKVAPGSAIVVEASHDGARVKKWQTAAVHGLVAPRTASLRRAAAAATEQAVDLAHSLGRVWTVPPVFNFSGGRDSRVCAAGAVVAGLEASFRTMDIEPGEADTVRRLVELSPRPIELSVTQPERGTPADDLHDRIRNANLVHDGISNPMSAIRGPTRLPQKGFSPPLVTGHGGELGHGFYYSAAALKKLRRAGVEGIVERLERSGRQKHNAARDDAYALYLAEVRRTVEEGRSHGVEGPSLLDYYYLSQRLSFRAGLGSRNDRYSACATPAFVRACFDLTPRQRTNNKLHRAIVDRLVPQWSSVPFFHGGDGRLPEMNRDRIWEKPRHSQQLEEMLAAESVWRDLFHSERVHKMWADAKAGRGRSNYEPLFLRIAWRVCFEDHLRLLGDRATRDPDRSEGLSRSSSEAGPGSAS